MSPQADYVVSNGTGAAVRSDINGQLAAIVSNNSGASAPATTYAYMLWADTSTNLLKLRNGANSAWITVGDLTAANLGLATLASPTFTGTATIPTLTVSTAANIPLGSAASPTLYFTGDSNTGLYSPGADQVALSTGGTGRLFIDSSGRCGIGTSSPSQLLHIYQPLTNSQAYQIIENNRSRNAATQYKTTLGAWYTGVGIGADVNRFTIYEDGVGDRLVIDSSGRVGIGTTSPSDKFHIDGGNIRITGSNPQYIQAVGINLNFNTDSQNIIFSRSATEMARFDSSSRFLVGTSTAYSDYYGSSSAWTGIFQVARNANDAVAQFSNWNSTASASNGGTQLYLSACKSGAIGTHTGGALANGDSIGSIIFNASDGSNFRTAAWIQAAIDGTPGTADVPGRLVFSTTADGASSPTERMRIDSQGRVNIGTIGTVPTGIGLNLYSTSTADDAGAFSCGNANTTAAACVASFYTATNSTATSNVLIKFGINNYASGSGQINANGASAAAFGTFSDARLKENIEDLPSQWDNIKSLRPVEFDYVESFGGGHQIGFIAQEMQTVYPDAVGIGQDEMLTVTAWSKTEARLVKALQEALERIESLEAEVTALKAQ